jgi:hypothetical protein
MDTWQPFSKLVPKRNQPLISSMRPPHGCDGKKVANRDD